MGAPSWIAMALLFVTCVVNEGFSAVFNVDNFGAAGDGIHNDTEAFMRAWTSACALANSTDTVTVTVPAGRQYLVYPLVFQGPCKSPIVFHVAGTVNSPAEMSPWTPPITEGTAWLKFHLVRQVTINGGGIFDGHGQNWWSCKRAKKCERAPSNTIISNSSKVYIRDVTFRNSHQIHLNFQNSTHISVSDVTVIAPGDSPNTDGIHVANSSHVTISSSRVGTGDDCVSIISGSSHIHVNDIICGPGHGISIGSLGKNGAVAEVSKVTVDGAELTDTTNGVRIKTWQGGHGEARDITFKNVRVNNVTNPIIIDQFYCNTESSGTCGTAKSAVKIRQITYMNIQGTSARKVAVTLNCSDTVACTDITMKGIRLVQTDGTPAIAKCKNVEGNADLQVDLDLAQCVSTASKKS